MEELPGRRSAAVEVVEPPSGRTGVLGVLLRLVMPLTDLPMAILYFVVMVTGLSLSVSLLAVFLLGIPVFLLLGVFARGLAALERHRMRLFLDVDIPSPPRRRPGWRALFTDGPTWRAIGYGLVYFPLGVLTFSVCLAGFATSLAMISMPFWLSHVPARRANLGLLTINNQSGAWLSGGAGLLLLCLCVGIAVGLTGVEGALARAMLGVSARQLERRVDELQGSRARVVDAAEAERRRIERDLHDGAQQRLVAMAMNLGRAKASYDDDPEAARKLLDEAHSDAKQALVELRDLARGLHPAVLTDRGLDAALSGLAARCPIPVVLDVAVEPSCSPTIEAIAYFVVSESLTNVAKHSGAKQAQVVVRRSDRRLQVLIADDGVGGANTRPGGGLAGLADRVSGVDGSLRVDSPAGGPTSVEAWLPCES